MRILYDVHAAGGTVKGGSEDAARAAKHAAAYKAVGAATAALVERWLVFFGKPR